MNYSKGFTLIELIISISIFTFMTIFLLAKYGKFNEEVLLTNLAYDVALTVRNAQSYGLNVKSVGGDDEFGKPYGVHFTVGNTFIFFRDSNNSNTYNSGEEIGSPYVIRRTNLSITSVCATDIADKCRTSNTSVPPTVVDVLFKRPDPNAIITLTDTTYGSNEARSQAQIKIQSSSDTTTQKRVIIRSTGEIAITD